jgi:hypothetical protein
MDKTCQGTLECQLSRWSYWLMTGGHLRQRCDTYSCQPEGCALDGRGDQHGEETNRVL